MEIFGDYFAFLIDYNRTIDKDCVYLSLNSCKCVIVCFKNIFYLAVDFHKMATLLDSFPESTSARLFPRAKTSEISFVLLDRSWQYILVIDKLVTGFYFYMC
jgi:hypothetical protein